MDVRACLKSRIPYVADALLHVSQAIENVGGKDRVRQLTVHVEKVSGQYKCAADERHGSLY